MEYWIAKALETGFTHAVSLNTATLMPRQDVRDMCAADKCGAYQKNWTCPPAVGTIAQCRDRIGQYSRGLLLQTVGQMTKVIDSRCYRETERRHLENLSAIGEELRTVYPDVLCLGAGGCRVCKRCAYPEPCRFPGRAMSSMEAYGLFVTQVCRDAGVNYYHGERTITYTACILLK